MPEGIEVEFYRRALAGVVGRRIDAVEISDSGYLRGGLSSEDISARLIGASVTAARRVGKLLIIDTDSDATIGLRFGMTGRLIVDGVATIDELEYASKRDDPGWDRFGLRFFGGGTLFVRDQRRLGSVTLEPDESVLGVDLYEVRPGDLAEILASSGRPLKSRIMDQGQIAGLGNLLADEILWRAGLDPRRPANSLSPTEVGRLFEELRSVVTELTVAGGSHLGLLMEHRRPGGVCPRDGALLERHAVGGRTTYACSQHQAGQG